jgi:phage shock protein A
MANPFVKGWRYLMALFGAKIDEHADPKVQIQQAIEDAQRQHQALVQQAAAVIGNQRQLEMRLSRQLTDVERLQSSTRQALVLADKARTDGNAEEVAKYENTAQTFATQLIAGEQSMEDLKALHDQALGAATQARKAVENNAHLLQQKLAERTKLLSQLEQAKMQETVARSLESMSSLAAPGNTPSLEEVRDKIERRYANAMGRAELASNSVEGRMLEVQKTTLDMAGASRLEQIRASMAAELSAAPDKPAVTGGDARPAEMIEGDDDRAYDDGKAVDDEKPIDDRPIDQEAATDDRKDATVSRIDEIRASLNKDKSAS